jgi:hypothetical protein
MNDNELSNLLREAKEQSPKPARALATRTMQAYRAQFVRPSFFRRHWRLATAAAALLVVIGAFGTRSSTGSPLPPEYDRPGIIGSGSMETDGWRMDYYTVVRPFIPGPQTASFEGGGVTRAKTGRPIIFHRFLGDGVTKIYFGYDIVLHPDGLSGKMTFRPLSVEPDDMPAEFHAAGSRIVAVQELPTKTFESGQNVVITLLIHPDTGQKVVDYVHVDTNFFDMVHHVLGNMIMTVHRHIQSRERHVQ